MLCVKEDDYFVCLQKLQQLAFQGTNQSRLLLRRTANLYLKFYQAYRNPGDALIQLRMNNKINLSEINKSA